MLKEFEQVYLTEDLKGSPFIKGDVGVVVHIYEDKQAYEVEFFAIDGSTLEVETVPAKQVKSCVGIKSVVHIHDLAA